jgi:hypothetical protein
MEVGEYYTQTITSEPNVWIVDSINVGPIGLSGNNNCKLRLVSGTDLGYISSRDGLYHFGMSTIDTLHMWVKINVMARKDIKKHTL